MALDVTQASHGNLKDLTASVTAHLETRPFAQLDFLEFGISRDILGISLK